jgi:hypothetical protein
MEQRVNIQYSVEIEELEAEVQRIVLSAFEDLTAAQTAAAAIKSPEFLCLKMVEDIEQIRVSMMRADIRLSDASNIINGYINLKTRPIELPADNNNLVDEEQMSQLKAKIDAFKNSYAAAGAANELAD